MIIKTIKYLTNQNNKIFNHGNFWWISYETAYDNFKSLLPDIAFISSSPNKKKIHKTYFLDILSGLWNYCTL